MSNENNRTIQNETLSLTVKVESDEAWSYRLYDKSRHIHFADLDYGYGLVVNRHGAATTCKVGPRTINQADERSITIKGTMLEAGIRFTHRFVFNAEEPFLNEHITLVNETNAVIEIAGFDFGFRKMMLRQHEGWAPGMDRLKLASLPMRRYVSQTVDRRLTEYSAHDLIYQNWTPQNAIPGYGAEAWAWYGETGGLLVMKYNVKEMELSRFALDPQKLPGRGVADLAVCFGGASLQRGDPEASTRLPPNASYTFGVSRYAAFDGGYDKACYLYRSHLEANGHRLPPEYNPPVHWNELYNLGWFAECRKSLLGEGSFTPYTREDLWREAGNATSVGAESLYLDPGWDTFPGSCIWDTTRLGALADFAGELKERFGLKLALELMMSFDSENEVEAFYVRDAEEKRVPPPRSIRLYDACTNEVWVKEKSRRLLELAKAGVSFFMFDFTYHAPCQSREHGHDTPRSRQAHAEGLLAVVQNIKREFPELIIELHDRVSAGVGDYHASYYQHGLPHSYDENWGYEYMWFPMQDLVSQKALSLYEYNMASPIPLYLHINENGDNSRMLQFWWYASVARHLGIGGVGPEHRNFHLLTKAMQLYLRLKSWFTQGIFYGLDPLIHLHVNPAEGSGVVTAYNLSGEAQNKTITLALPQYQLACRTIIITNGLGEKVEPTSIHHEPGVLLKVEIPIPTLSPVIIELRP